MNKISGTRALTYIDIRAPTLRDTKFVSISCWESGIEPIGGGMQAASLTLKATEGMYEGREFFFRLDLPFRFKDSVPQSVADRQPSKRQRLASPLPEHACSVCGDPRAKGLVLSLVLVTV